MTPDPDHHRPLSALDYAVAVLLVIAIVAAGAGYERALS